MPDLLASTALLPLKPAIPARGGPGAAPVAADFTVMLGELAFPGGAKPQGGKGQSLAGDGKILPVGDQADGEDDEGDTVIAWLPTGFVPLEPIEPVALPDLVSVGVSEADAGTLPIALAEPAMAEPAPTDIAVIEVETAPAEMPITPEIEPRIELDMPTRTRPSTSALQPIVPGAATASTAAQVFAAAISASFEMPAAPVPRAGDPGIVQAQAATEQLRTTVQAMSGADQPPLDLSRDDWAGKMVDRIAAMRDAAEAADTRIRLAPENLGNVDVSIRRDGDRIHVHFSAENPATRQLLAEAAPRLAELADARGVRLGQTSVDAGAGGQQGAPDQQQPTQSVRPAPVAAPASEADHDDRIA